MDVRQSESETKYRDIFEAAHDVILVVHRDDNILDINRRAETLLGFTRAELCRMNTFRDLSVPEDEPAHRGVIEDLLVGKTCEYEVCYKAKDGRQLYLECSAVPRFGSDGAFLDSICCLHDITERKHLEARLKVAEELHGLVLSNISDAVFVTNETGHFTYVCPNVATIFGFSREEVFVRSHIANFVEKEVVELLDGSEALEIANFEHNITDKFGSEHLVLTNVKRVNIGEGTRLYTFRDITERKRIEKARAQSEELFSKVFQLVPAALFIMTLEDARIHRINEYTLTLLGYVQGEFKQAKDLWKNAHIYEELVQTVREKGSVYGIETEWQSRTGESIDVMLSVELMEVEGRACILGIGHDLTERKRMDHDLRTSEELYRELFDSNPHPMFIADIETRRFLAVNDACVAKYGYSRDEFVQLRADDIRVPEDIPDTVEKFARFDREDMHYMPLGVRRHVKKDGSLLYSELIVNRLKFEGKDAIFGVAYDLTDRLRADENVRRSEARFSTIFQSVPVAIGIHSASDGRLMNVNPTLLALSGYSADELLGLPYWTIPVWTRGNQLEQFEQTMRESGTVSNLEFEWMRKDGKPLDMLISAVRVDIHGEPSVLTIGLDISERKQAEQMRLEVYKEREILDLKERFISKMSHEFRTPLAVILASTDSLIHYYDRISPERRQEKLKGIIDQVRYVNMMLDDVLTIGKARSGNLKFNPAMMNLVEHSRIVFEQLQSTDQNEHHYIFEAVGKLEHCRADRSLIQHILVNLLSNAIKYSPYGGDVRFELRQDDGTASIKISDQGIGIPEDDQKHLFEPFYRASNAGQIKGTGLGLTIVKESVEAHGGTIAVESAPGQGTTFHIRLPIQMSS